MKSRWRAENRGMFIRNILRDYCIVYTTLHEQALRFEKVGTMSYAVLRDLLGEETQKGVFWRLKDTAHHAFRAPDKSAEQYEFVMETHECTTQTPLMEESVLDWCIGYVFHECIKLKEGAFQCQHYTNRLLQMRNRGQSCTQIIEQLESITQQARQGMQDEMDCIFTILRHIRTVLLQYLATEKNNGHIARLLVAEQALIQSVFAEDWATLLHALYDDDIGMLYCMAAKASMESSRFAEVRELLATAKEHNTKNILWQELSDLLQSKTERL